MKTLSAGVTLARFASAFLNFMISKLCACWLVVLVLSPFTAPFATCDLARPIRGTGRGGPAGAAIAAATSDTSAALVPSRFKTGRQKLLSSAERVERFEPAPSIDLPHAERTSSIPQHEALRAVLRL